MLSHTKILQQSPFICFLHKFALLWGEAQLYLPYVCVRVVVGGGGRKVATNFNVSSRQGFEL